MTTETTEQKSTDTPSAAAQPPRLQQRIALNNGAKKLSAHIGDLLTQLYDEAYQHGLADNRGLREQHSRWLRVLSTIAERVGAPVGSGFGSDEFREMVLRELPDPHEANRATLVERVGAYRAGLHNVATALGHGVGTPYGLGSGPEGDKQVIDKIVAEVTDLRDRLDRTQPHRKLYRCVRAEGVCGWRGREPHESVGLLYCPECNACAAEVVT